MNTENDYSHLISDILERLDLVSCEALVFLKQLQVCNILIVSSTGNYVADLLQDSLASHQIFLIHVESILLTLENFSLHLTFQIGAETGLALSVLIDPLLIVFVVTDLAQSCDSLRRDFSHSSNCLHGCVSHRLLTSRDVSIHSTQCQVISSNLTAKGSQSEGLWSIGIAKAAIPLLDLTAVIFLESMNLHGCNVHLIGFFSHDIASVSHMVVTLGDTSLLLQVELVSEHVGPLVLLHLKLRLSDDRRLL